jgi:two-component system phosphate regulon sensor histidine kinase PhoR
MSESDIDESLGDIIGRIVLTGLITFVTLSLISYVSERRIIAPLADIRKAAEIYSGGNLDYRISIPGPEDMKVVADTLNQMASTLKIRLSDISKSKIELEAVFSSITEAVVVLDGDLNVRQLNRSALNFVNKDSQILHRNLIEVFRSSELQALAEETLESQTPVERLIRFGGNQDRFFQVHGTRIIADSDQRSGNAVVLVMNDITKTQHLENLRRDFVANVSHELKTPITNIKGYLETLTEDGVLDDRETVERFLSVSIRNADRLNAILDDLLSLSRLEQVGKTGLDFDTRSLSGIVAAAFQSCGPMAMEKKIDLRIQGDKDAQVCVNSLLMEQAISNLIGNAVKYSDEGSSVKVRIRKKDKSVDIEVIDEGIGIPERDLPRIFERFYRVDKARSRDMGGTGLGLAIVKHIVNRHRGQLTIRSTPGEGTRVEVLLNRK